jgi:hypothetical protein
MSPRSAGRGRHDGGAGGLADPASGQCAHPAGDREKASHSWKMRVTVDRHGNTSAASIPLALDEAVRAGRISAASTCCWKASVAASPGARPCSNSELEKTNMKFALVFPAKVPNRWA